MIWLTGKKCIECDKYISPKSTRCRTCSNHSRILDLPRWKRVGRKEYQRIYMKTVYYEKKKEADRKYVHRLKKELFGLLGNKCKQCGYSGQAIQIDHVNNNGSLERKKFPASNATFLNYVLRKVKADSKDYQLLCANCNIEKELLRRGYRP